MKIIGLWLQTWCYLCFYWVYLHFSNDHWSFAVFLHRVVTLSLFLHVTLMIWWYSHINVIITLVRWEVWKEAYSEIHENFAFFYYQIVCNVANPWSCMWNSDWAKEEEGMGIPHTRILTLNSNIATKAIFCHLPPPMPSLSVAVLHHKIMLGQLKAGGEGHSVKGNYLVLMRLWLSHQRVIKF